MDNKYVEFMAVPTTVLPLLSIVLGLLLVFRNSALPPSLHSGLTCSYLLQRILGRP